MDAEKLAMQRRIDNLQRHIDYLYGELSDYERQKAKLTAELDAVNRERDAEIRDMSDFIPCDKCVHWNRCKNNQEVFKPCAVTGFKRWKWRGLCESNGGKDGKETQSDR